MAVAGKVRGQRLEGRVRLWRSCDGRRQLVNSTTGWEGLLCPGASRRMFPDAERGRLDVVVSLMFVFSQNWINTIL
jgi:hypothetical protein